MIVCVILLSVLLLAYANGANDNFKGVATLFGSGTTNYRRALMWATLTTFLGSLAAVVLAGQLLKYQCQGFTRNRTTGLILIGASNLGMLISTTHVSCGA